MDSNKRYSLVIPQELYDEVNKVAEERGATFVELMRRFIKLGLFAISIENDPDRHLIFRQNGEDTIIMFM